MGGSLKRSGNSAPAAVASAGSSHLRSWRPRFNRPVDEQGEPLPAPSLADFGLPTPDHLTGLAMRYQIAQKAHAASDPHEPLAG
jgi:hypothetical protein